MDAEQVTPALAHHGEGPVWISGTRWPDGLYWVDMLAGDVLSLDARGQVGRRSVGEIVATIRPRASGGLAYAIDRGFALDDGPGTPLRRLPDLWPQRDIRMNEGGCDPAGPFYAGSMAYDARPGAGALYRLAPDGRTDLVETDWTIPNGLEWTPDGRTAYHVDTRNRRIDVWSWDAARGLHDRRAWVRTDCDGQPDGLTVDIEGGVWVAMWGASCIHRYAPDGSLSEVVHVPVAQVSACTFGGPAHDELYITTSREALADPEPAAGAVFRMQTSVQGVSIHPYSG